MSIDDRVGPAHGGSASRFDAESARRALETGDEALPPINPCANPLPVHDTDEQGQRLDIEAVRHYAHYKRLRELFLGDPEVRKSISDNTETALAELGLKIPEQVVSALRSALADGQGWPFPDLDALVPAPHRSNWRHMARAFPIENPAFKAWKDRQFHRTRGQFQLCHQELIQEIVAVYELSRGCSGNCGFCCFDAPALKDNLPWTPENARWWRDILEVVRQVLGPGAVAAAGYWATDPFDNPNYEDFTAEFQKVNSWHLRTTTLLWDRDFDRARRYLQLMKASGQPYSYRFSVVSLKQLRLLHRSFSPEALATVSVSVNNRQSLNLYTPTGRARRLESRSSWQGHFYEGSTSACLSGFLFNMLDRTVELISPCPPDPDHPKGYIVFAKRRFDTARDLEDTLNELIKTHMPIRPAEDERLQLRSDLAVACSGEQIEFKTRYLTKKLAGDHILPHYVDMLRSHDATPSRLRGFASLHAAGGDHADDFVDFLFANGLLNQTTEKPEGESRAD